MEDDNWDTETAWVELNKDNFSPEALKGLDAFSHAEIIFYMDKVDPKKVEKMARHPRNNEEWPKVGIFAQRGKNRPNQIGATICEIIKIEDGSLYVKGLDAIDGTPVLDIKPWVKEFAPRGNHRQPQWITELMEGYWQK
jgi:tRNA-Thr(GGU) m(6)t(6)A37 methyltransferase TsaA